MLRTSIFINNQGEIGFQEYYSKLAFYKEVSTISGTFLSTDRKAYSNIESLRWSQLEVLDVEMFIAEDQQKLRELKEINYCWKGTIQEFLHTDKETWIKIMKKYYLLIVKSWPSNEQVKAWIDEHYVLQREIGNLVSKNKRLNKGGIIFEYKLPFTGGKRPDVILLINERVYVLEFKSTLESKKQSAIDQIDFYCRNLQYYHKYSQDHIVIPILLPLNLNQSDEHKSEDIFIISQYGMFQQFEKLASVYTNEEHIQDFITSEYAPLPTIVELASSIFNNKKLPGVNDENIKEFKNIIDKVNEIILKTKVSHGKSFIFITGVSGAGKTYLGLDIDYNNIDRRNGQINSCYISGNSALISVLRKTLGENISDAYIKSFHSFKEHYYDKGFVPKENIIIFDEGQRAWENEPDVLKRISDNITNKSTEKWCCIILLVGSGQELTTEESSIMLSPHDDITVSSIGKWNRLLDDSWYVYGTQRIHSELKCTNCYENEQFGLRVSLRGHLNKQLSDWVDNLLKANAEQCKFNRNLMPDSYKIYITRDFKKAKKTCKDLYIEEYTNTIYDDKRFGLIASSFTQKIHKGYNSYYVDGKSGLDRKKRGIWFCNSPTDKESCCSFTSTANEYDIQGLELDMTLLTWNNDLILQDGKWVFNEKYYNDNMNMKKGKRKKELEHLKNTYRVLLTRARDGMIIFVPNEIELDFVYRFIKDSGAEELI